MVTLLWLRGLRYAGLVLWLLLTITGLALLFLGCLVDASEIKSGRPNNPSTKKARRALPHRLHVVGDQL
jgi:hypothetical protein